MKTHAPRPILISTLVTLGGIFASSGCTSEYSGGGGGDVDFHGSFYYGVGYAPGFYGPAYYPPPTVIVTPPPGRPGGGYGGGARPTPMPSMPSARPRR